MHSHSLGICESAEFPTGVKEALAMCAQTQGDGVSVMKEKTWVVRGGPGTEQSVSRTFWPTVIFRDEGAEGVAV